MLLYRKKGFSMTIKINFSEFIREISHEKEAYIIHELANKFNLLSLNIEDIEEALAEVDVSVSSLREELNSLLSQKNKFLTTLNHLKGLTNPMDSSCIDTKTALSLALSLKSKAMRDKLCTFKLTDESINEVPQTQGRELFLWIIALRIYLNGSIEWTINLSSKEASYREELNLLKDVDEDFKVLYLNEYVKMLEMVFNQ